MTNEPPKVLSIGQCGVDGPAITRIFDARIGAKVDSAATMEEARCLLESTDYALVLVNRILAGDGGSGLDVVTTLADETETPVMLVSDHDGAQQQAEQSGALRGFGKSALYQDATVEYLSNIIKRKPR